MTNEELVESKKLITLNAILVIVFVLFLAGSYLYGGIDFAKGTLVGCIIVAINFFISQRLIRRLLQRKSANPLLIVMYLVKLGISIIILFLAVVRFKLDVVALMLGLSSIVIAIVVSAFFQRNPAEQGELKK